MKNYIGEISPLSNQPDKDSILFRYITVKKLLDFIIKKRISLVRMSNFEDKLEGINVDLIFSNYARDQINSNVENDMGKEVFNLFVDYASGNHREDLTRNNKIFKNSNYASCWHEGTHESLAMWELYSNTDSVAITIPFDTLQKEIDNKKFKLDREGTIEIKYGKVLYKPLAVNQKIGELPDYEKDVGFIKDLSFKHENEFRIIAKIQNSKNEKKKAKSNERLTEFNKPTIDLHLNNFDSLPFKIIFHPKSEKWHQENIIELINKFELLNFQCIPSSLTRVFNS